MVRENEDPEDLQAKHCYWNFREQKKDVDLKAAFQDPFNGIVVRVSFHLLVGVVFAIGIE